MSSLMEVPPQRKNSSPQNKKALSQRKPAPSQRKPAFSQRPIPIKTQGRTFLHPLSQRFPPNTGTVFFIGELVK